MSDERKTQLGRLIAIEVRALAQLPRLDLWSLRSTTNVRESGVDLRGPDCGAAERCLVALRDHAGSQLELVAQRLAQSEAARSEEVESAQSALDDLARAIELLDATLHPRLNDPPITIAQALDRALGARSQRPMFEGDIDTNVRQVRGLIRLLSEVVTSVGPRARVNARRDGPWLELTVAPAGPPATSKLHGLECAHLLQLAAYLLRIQARRDDADGWRLTVLQHDARFEGG